MFSRPSMEQRQAESQARKERNLAGLCNPSRSLHRSTYTGSVSGKAVDKSEPYRDPALLEMARGRICLLCVRGGCICTPGSVVACHSNLGIHGKAKGRKADDCYSVWGGDMAHHFLDRSGASREKKEAAFMAAHVRQVEAWRIVADDPAEPERFRRAARRALERLGAVAA